jgi:AAA+ superfamily predicted ATPase
MKFERVVVDGAAMDAGIAVARTVIFRCGLPALLAEADPGGFGTTPLNLRILEALSQACAVAIAIARVSPPTLPASYAAFVMAEEAVARLAALGPVQTPRPAAMLPVSQYADLATASPSAALDAALADCAGFLRFYLHHPDAACRLESDRDALSCVYAYFRLLSRAAATLTVAEPAFEIVTPDLSVRGFTVSRGGESSELLPVSFEDIVGNDELIKAGRRIAQDVAGFDLRAGANPKKIRNQILFVLGSPGCGKTATAHAIGRYFLELCAKGGLPARMRVVRRTDWASAYQNQSARSLLDIFQNEVFHAPGVTGVYWPDIDTAFAARSDSDIRQEEKNILGTLFGILDGTIGPKDGRWFLIADANTVNMDAATLSRIAENPIRANGPQTPGEYERLLRDIKLRGKGPWLPISGEEWAAIAALCVEARLSGRAIDHIAGQVLAFIEDFEPPGEYYMLPFEEKTRLVEQLSRPVTAAQLREFIDHYCRFEREAQEKAEAERFIERVREIRLHLSAQRAAANLLGERADGVSREE